VLAALAAFVIALPAFLAFENPDTREGVPATLAAGAIAGLVLLMRGAWRGVSAWRSTRLVTRAWRRHGRRVDIGAPIAAYAVDQPFPTVAVVGIGRPVLLIAERVLRECSAAEVRAMVAHECAHVTARDNLRRFVMRACPDVLRAGGVLERAWVSAAEEAADQAASSATGSSLDLADALVRVARLAPMPAPELASAFYIGGSIESRVRRLLNPPADRQLAVRIGPAGLSAFALLGVGVLVAAAPRVHHLIELAIHALP
jgi:beta-lactamase regulating signal transducer with metallopeptidase domain